MNSKITFLNDQFLGFYLLGAVLLLVVLIYKEFRNSRKSVFFLRVFIGMIAIASLLAIALKPAYQSTKKRNKAIVITEGAKEAQLDSLKKIYPKITKIEYSSGDFISPELEAAGEIFVLGYGIEDYDLFQFENKKVSFLPAELQAGIDKITYPKELIEGEMLNIKAHFFKPEDGYKAYLKDFGGNKLDSVTLTEADFELKAKTKVKGEFVYQIEVQDSVGNIFAKEPLPIKINTAQKLRILVLNDFPSFETRYLKNFLAEEGHQVTLRTQLTSNRYKYEYLNTEEASFSAITQEFLNDFDVLVVDISSFNQFSAKEKQDLEMVVKRDGLGVFIQQTENTFQQKTLVDFDIQLDGLPKIKWPENPEAEIAKFPYVFQDSNNTYSLIANEKNLVVYKYLGRGKVGSGMLQNTYQLVLNGNNQVYREIWTDVFSRLAKPAQEMLHWEVENSFTNKNEPVNLAIKTALESPKLIDSLEHEIPLLQHLDLEDDYSAALYPKDEGWNHLKLAAGDSIFDFEFYVFQTDSWKSKRSSDRLKSNWAFFEETTQDDHQEFLYRPLNLLWFYLTFLIAMAFLWLHPKLLRN
ncbi:hypothetical protein INR75_16405 [Zunongwangia sp. SCSIO 43204]|uniref:hypothetical protein n=1 Tax=Zunongwangia sp. SCSIO 43204 TaxID=2779359 RepID=UPI001CA7D1FD|nr:hypothetical protein [Zunongwangia sp. SCSIO 43204]UAB83737.1 hypothetical protein INR75_16405 [Zunongwangia sp. SCSIO 43204]